MQDNDQWSLAGNRLRWHSLEIMAKAVRPRHVDLLNWRGWRVFAVNPTEERL
jgi:N-dimethylarginine dimethylaminohydrolase